MRGVGTSERRLLGTFPRTAGFIGLIVATVWVAAPGTPETVMATYMALTALVAFAYDPPTAPLPPPGERHDLEHIAAGVVPLLLWRLAEVPLAMAIGLGVGMNLVTIWRRQRTRRPVRDT